jgi:tRNA A37 N6-isopentenylltransferase MiaA
LPATVFLDGFAALEGRAEQLRIQAVENARVHIIEQMQSHQVTDMTDAEIDKAAEDSAQAEIENLISEERARWESSAYQLLQWRSFVTAMEVRFLGMV